MTVAVRSFAKINLGLRIGLARADGFHELQTVYQTIALHDEVRVSARRGSGIEIRCADPRVPTDDTNTCFRIAELALRAMRKRARIIIEIDKRLPVQGGLGGASSNAVATLLAMERVLKKPLRGAERLRIAAEVGSDLPLFLVGGAALGVGRGEQVYPLPDFPAMPCVILTPEIGVSTPKAFAAWDEKQKTKLTASTGSDRMMGLSRELSTWLSEPYSSAPSGTARRGRAENPLLWLVRAGIENDFEQVVLPEYPELREGRSALLRAGAKYASLSGSGSTLYGLFASKETAALAVQRLRKQGWAAQLSATLPRRTYWERMAIGA